MPLPDVWGELPRIPIPRTRVNRGMRQGRGSRAPAFSCTATGEEWYFCCPLDRCGLTPASPTVSPRSGKDPPPPSGPSRVFSQAGRLQHHITSGVRPSLCPGPMPQDVSYLQRANLYLMHVQERCWVMRCSALTSWPSEVAKPLLKVHKTSLSIAQEVA
jgi:hypothetical protein